MAGDKWDGFVPVDWVRSAGHSAAVAGTRAGERSRHRWDRASAP